MIEVDIDQDTLDRAYNLSREMGRLRNSITKGEGNLAGFVGEIIVNDYLKGSTISNTYDYDIITKTGYTIDVKTKRTTVTPKDYYECSIANYNTKQKCYAYAFVRVDLNRNLGWILGFYHKDRYFEDATFRRKGEKDPNNNFTFKADCYNMPIKNLKNMS